MTDEKSSKGTTPNNPLVPPASPVFVTETAMKPALSDRRNSVVTPPFSVNFMALDMRLPRI